MFGVRRAFAATFIATLGVTVSTFGSLTPSAQADPEPCFDGGTLDFNGDGYTDAAVGDPYATVGGKAGAGRVVVLYGDADGRVGQGARAVLTVADLGATPHSGDHFGAAIGTGQIDADYCADLVIGAPGENLPAAPDAGGIHLVLGSKDGLNAGYPSQHITQADAEGSAEAGDHFGRTIVVGENLGQDTSVVVAGAPGEDVGAVADAGAVHVLNFSDSILVQPRQVTQNTAGIPGAAEAGDQFGASLALGVDMLRDFHSWELLVGAPGESVGSLGAAGSVTLITDIQGYPPTGTWKAVGYSQNSPGVGGVAEPGDRFGASLAVGSRNIYNPASVRRVAVGVPGEDVGPIGSAGAVNLFTASGSGLHGATYLTQDSPGVSGAAESGDHFGASVAVMAGTTWRLAVGSPNEDVGSAIDAGLVQVFDFDHVATDSALTQNSTGAAGVVHSGSRYGLRVVALEGKPERVWLIGNPYHATGAVHVVSVGGVFTSRAWLPGSGGVPGGATRFGWSAGGHDNLG